MIEHKNIQEAIGGIYGDVGYVQKVSSKQLSYTFASESGFIQALRPAFINHGVILRVVSMELLRLENYESRSGNTMTKAVVTGTVEFIHTVSNTSIAVQALGEGADAGDKSINKAMTGMYKYALRQTFLIETGDDPDNTPSEERKPKSVTETAKELGGVVVEAMSIEEAGSITTEDGVPYAKLPIEELTIRFNGMTKLKRNNPEKFTPEHAKKMAAIKQLIAEHSK